MKKINLIGKKFSRLTVLDEWLNDFMVFYNWSINNGYRDNLTIDRIDNDGDYEPSNCRWVGMKVQSNNRRNTIHLTYCGKTQTISEWAELLGLSYNTIWKRYHKHKSIEDILHKEV